MANEKELTYEHIFGITTTALHISGAHPSVRRDLKWALKFIILHGIFTLGFFTSMYSVFYHDLKEKNFILLCKNCVTFVLYCVVTFQYCMLLFHQDTVVELIKNVNSDYKELPNLSDIEKELMYKYVKQGVRVCRQWFVLTVAGTLSFILKSGGLMLYYYFINDFRYVSLYDVKFPACIEERRNDHFFVFLATYFFLMFFACYSALNYVAYVPLGPIFMLHACGQIELVRNRVEVLFSGSDVEEIRMKLKDIIKKLQYIYSTVDDMKRVFKFGYEITLKGTAVLLPITFYAVLETAKNGEVSLEFITFIIGGIMISAAPCYYSDLLMEKGEALRLSLYTCGWEMQYDRRTRTTLQLMLQKALRPVAIQTIFRTLCLDALTDVKLDLDHTYNKILVNMDDKFEKDLKLFLIPMRLTSTSPEIPLTIKRFIRHLFGYIIFTAVAIVITYNTYISITNRIFFEACRNLTLSLTYFGCCLNTMLSFWNRRSLKTLLETIRNDYKMAAQLPPQEQLIFEDYSRKKSLICKIWFHLFVVSLCLFVLKAFTLMVYYYFIGEFRLVHLYELTYPDYIEKRKGDLVMYLFIFLMVFLYGVISGLGFLSFVPYGTVCMLHACGHLEIAKNRIDSLFTGDSRFVNEKLKNIAQLLQYTYHFIEYSNGCLRFFYDAILKLSAIAIPVTFYALLEGLRHGVFSMEFTMFILNAIMLTSIPCYLSDKLLEKGEEVRLALYSCGWECEYNRRMRVTILLLQTRCSRPIAVQTMFTTLCLYAMFQQAYTILNLMNAVWN
ncbi:hypothetical protein HW555_004596 [Spodoptera exigua]|uniref:Odorant receptor n=1 Tax=Spodoptera exigua TaxID=7107 RepID=A0A835GMW5_SPOEX|nr:hypothetical protein HW555_004596 [Spodoptera exigua]